MSATDLVEQWAILVLLGAAILGVSALCALWLGRRRMERRARILELCALGVERAVDLASLFDATAARQHPRDPVNRTLRALAQATREGHSLSGAFARVDRMRAGRGLFPDRVVAAVGAAEGGSGLAHALRRECADHERSDGAWQRLLLALVYPALLATVMLGAHAASWSFRVVARTHEGGAPLQVSSMTVWLPTIVLGITAAVALLRLLSTGVIGRRGGLLGLVARAAHLGGRLVPAMGRARRLVAQERALGALAAQLRGSAPLGYAFRAAAGTCGDPGLGAQLIRAADEVDSGVPPDTVWGCTGLPEVASLRAASTSRPSALIRAMDEGAVACQERLASLERRVALWVPPVSALVFGAVLLMFLADVESVLDQARRAPLEPEQKSYIDGR